jgi:site-specific DNA-cytosine methylase
METKELTFGSVCSGIEAASVAWHPLGWKAAWFSEIEPFPSAVLAYHYPDTPNLGDMTTLPERIRNGEIVAPDILCGGTPCQSFSVAGVRRSLDDARGNLSLIFCEVSNAIDDVRRERGDQPAIIFWENVPGVLNTKDNAFGCFLAGLVGDDEPAQAPDKKWKNSGVVVGPERLAVWRVLDAQYFGVAQRRRRVFVLSVSLQHPRAWPIAESLLPLSEGVRRDTAPLHGKLRGRGKTVAGCLSTRTGAYDRQELDTLIYDYHATTVRVLTPLEQERLQGFADKYTDIPWRGKPQSPDGPRYKALGNSWAVPVVRWIGERMQRAV